MPASSRTKYRRTPVAAEPYKTDIAKAKALLSSTMQKIACEQRGFRGPLGSTSAGQSATFGANLPSRITSIMPMPDADTMLKLVGLA